MAREGKIDLTEFVANHGPKVCNQAIQTGHELIEATRKLEPAKKTRIELSEESGLSLCVEDCHGHVEEGSTYRNVYLFGPANCGKPSWCRP